MTKKSKILTALKKGDQKSFLNELYTSVLPKVRAYVMKNSGNMEDANDIFQDAVVVFYKQMKLTDFEIQQSVEAYIFTVARNLWINKAKRDARIQYTDDIIETEFVDQNALSHLISEERANTIQSVLSKLGERCAQLLNYVIYQDYSLTEVTELMGFGSVEVTHTTNYRCKKKLTELLRNNEAFRHLLKSEA